MDPVLQDEERSLCLSNPDLTLMGSILDSFGNFYCFLSAASIKL